MQRKWLLPLGLLLLAPLSAHAQDGEGLYEALCAACHNEPPDETIPPVRLLRQLDPGYIVDVLTSGAMSLQGQALNTEQKVQVAEWLAGAPVALRDRRLHAAAVTAVADGR
jgi:mono/diheme cytochrome c family protein